MNAPRVTCDAAELPAWLWERGDVRLCMSYEGRSFVTNGHVLIDAWPNDRFGHDTRSLASFLGGESLPVERDTWPVPGGAGTSGFLSTFGEVAIDLTYCELVENLFPGCQWSKMGGPLDPVRAHVGGHIVAAVMPCSSNHAVQT